MLNIGDITFIDLEDTPNQYASNGLKIVRVKNDETGTEFYDLESVIDIINKSIDELDVNVEGNKSDIENLQALLAELQNSVSQLADVATSGDYNDLENLPTIPTIDNFVEKTGDTMTGALNIDATGTALSVPYGDINIGTEPGGYSRLHVDGKVSITEELTVGDVQAGDVYIYGDKIQSVATTASYNDLVDTPTIPTTDNFVEKTGDTMTGVLSIDATGTALSVPNGNTGFGLPNPTLKLQARLTDVLGRHQITRFEKFTTGVNHYLDIFIDNEDNMVEFISSGSSDGGYKFGNYGNNNHIVIKNGNVGINTTTPQAKLDVNGDLRTNSILEKSKNGSVSGGSYFLIWDSYGNHDIILTQNTEILQGDIPPVGYSQVITLNVIGDFALTLPVEWVIKNGGVYDGVNGSQIVVQSWDNGNFYTVIN